MLGPEDGVGGWTKHHFQPDSFMDLDNHFQQPLPRNIPWGLCKEGSVEHIYQATLAVIPLFCHHH